MSHPRVIRFFLVFAFSGTFVGCGDSGNGSTPPTTPTPPPTPTRVIAIEGDLNFGEVAVGQTARKDIRIVNRGSDTLTVSGMTTPSGFAASWTNGSIASNQWQDLTVRFFPTGEQSYSGTLTVNANHTSGTNTLPISARGIQVGPRTQFGSGIHRVGTDIAPGRYYSDPSEGCYWARLSGFGGTISEIISDESIGSNARQWIVDISGSDRGFESDSDCGTWFSTPRHGPQGTATDGVWLVGAQLTPGDYRADVRPGCYWERLRSFDGTNAAVLANDFISMAGNRIVTIRPSDVGFRTDESCGTWSRISSAVALANDEPADQRPGAIEERREAERRLRARLHSSTTPR
jgi:hypothetical protein